MNSYDLTPIAKFILRNPVGVALAIMIFGLFSGFLLHSFIGQNLFERFGSVVVAVGAFIFGIVVSDLLARAQGSFFMADEHDPAELNSPENVRKTLNCQAFVIFAGTLQWGFGSLLFGVTQ